MVRKRQSIALIFAFSLFGVGCEQDASKKETGATEKPALPIKGNIEIEIGEGSDSVIGVASSCKRYRHQKALFRNKVYFENIPENCDLRFYPMKATYSLSSINSRLRCSVSGDTATCEKIGDLLTEPIPEENSIDTAEKSEQSVAN